METHTVGDNRKFIAVMFPNTSTDVITHDVNYSDPFFDYETPSEMVWADAIHQHYLKVICAVGLPGNLAAILTISTMKPRSVATFLVALLAASDSMALLMKVIINQLFFSLHALNDHYCRCSHLVNVCSTYANWVLVLIAAERLVAVVWPMMRNRFLTKLRVYCLCAVLALPIFAIHAPLIVSGKAIGRFRCGLSAEISLYANEAWLVLNNLFYALLPIVLLMGITTALSLALSRARRSRQQLLGSVGSTRARQANREMQRSERAITMMMLAASFLFMLMVLPQCLYFILFRYTEVLTDLQYTPKDHLIKQTTTLLADSTHALNFYLYFVSVRRFRQRVLLLLCCHWRCRSWSASFPERTISRTWSRENSNNNTFYHFFKRSGKGDPADKAMGNTNITTTTVTSSTFVERASQEMESVGGESC